MLYLYNSSLEALQNAILYFATVEAMSATFFGSLFAYAFRFSFEMPLAHPLASAAIFSSGIPLHLHK